MDKKPRISGIQSPPPDAEEYAFDAPEGEWSARLDYLRWGKGANLVPNLLCYFTEITTGRKYLFSAFKSNGYGPLQGDICFRHEHPGGIYRLVTGRNTKGKPVWHSAQRLEAATTDTKAL